jgi:Ca2+-binding EF-hand superfamily protein
VSVGDVARITSSAADGLVYPSSRVGVPNALSLVVLDELKSFLKDERKRFAGSTRAESFKRLDDWIERKLAQVLFDPEAPAHSNLRPTGSESDRSSSGDFWRKTSARGYAQGHEIKSNRGKRKEGSQSDEEHGTNSEHGKDDDGQALLPKSPPMRGVRSSAAGSTAPSGRPTVSPYLFVAGGRYPYPYKRSVSFLPVELPHSPTGQAAQGLAAAGDTSPAAVSSAQSRASSSAPSDRSLSFQELRDIFSTLDKNNDGSITHAELIKGLKENPWIADKFGMPAHIRQEDGTRNQYQLFLGTIDYDDPKTIEFSELCRFYGFNSDGSDLAERSHINTRHAGMHKLEWWSGEPPVTRGYYSTVGYRNDGKRQGAASHLHDNAQSASAAASYFGGSLGNASASPLSLGYFAEPCRWLRVPIGVGVDSLMEIREYERRTHDTTPSVWWRGEKTRTRGWGVAPYAVDDAAAPVRESVCAVKRVGEKEVPLLHYCIVFTK